MATLKEAIFYHINIINEKLKNGFKKDTDRYFIC